MSNDSNCGCGPSVPQPGNQMIVPPGTHIVQTPCPAVSPQSAIVPANALNMGGAGNSQNCGGFAMPTVAKSFVSAGTNQTGSFFSDCAGIWGLPGMMAYFPSQGQLEILGVSQNTVTYRNRTVPPGVEILEGIRFAVGIPLAPMEVVDDGPDTPTGPSEPTYEDASQLSNIRGVFNGTPSRISPVNNNILVGRGNAWQRRQLGQMRFPAHALLLNINRSAANVQYTINLPSKPVLPDEVSGFAIELNLNLAVTRNGSGSILQVRMLVDGAVVLHSNSDGARDQNTTHYVRGMAKDKTSVVFKFEKTTSPSGTMASQVYLDAYYY